MAQHTRGNAGVPDAIMNSTLYTRNQTLWMTSKLEDQNGRSYNKDGRRKNSIKGSKRKLPYHKTSGKTKN